ncbi:septin-7-like [Gorilla gorilla gorilla]|uniref:septin-7-like n=1 Tax=Gorilla gorilla gorilla TaxID=9595 RepID=UPI0030084589
MYGALLLTTSILNKEIQEHKVKIHEFPETDDEEEKKLVKKIKDHLPLAVVGSNTIIEVNDKRVIERQYPWSVAEVENGEHCDFTVLRNMLIRNQATWDVLRRQHNRAGRRVEEQTGSLGERRTGTGREGGMERASEGRRSELLIETNSCCLFMTEHTQDLKDVTNNVPYENYGIRKLAAVTYHGVDNKKNKGQFAKHLMITLNINDRSPLAQMEEERREQVAKIKKMELEMEQVFEMKVKEKVQKLNDSEAELQRRHEQMKKNLEAQHKELEEKRRQFEDEKANWEAQQRILEQQNSSRTLEKNKKKGQIF